MKSRGRPKTPVLERIQAFLDVPFLRLMQKTKTFPQEYLDQHWIWRGAIHPPTTKAFRQYNKRRYTDAFVMPARIRDDDGKLQSVIRILHKALKGFDYPYPPVRSHGCDFRCVNPFHLQYPDQPHEVVESNLIEDSEGLKEEITNFVGIHGFDKEAILNRFLLDYTSEEIEAALHDL